MNGIKLLLVTAEVLDLAVIIGWLFKRASENAFDCVDASIIVLFVCIAVIVQSMQQNIKWQH
jgi:hypothetical protein